MIGHFLQLGLLVNQQDAVTQGKAYDGDQGSAEVR